MNGSVVAFVMGGAVFVGSAVGLIIGTVLDKRRTKGGRHRASNQVVRSGLVMCLPCLMLLAAALPVDSNVSDGLSRTSYPEIGAQMGVKSCGG